MERNEQICNSTWLKIVTNLCKASMLQETEPAAASPPLCHVPESPVYQVYCIRSILQSALPLYCTVLYCTVLYQVYATIVAFYLPLTVIIILNTQIYVIARRIISRVRRTWHVARGLYNCENCCRRRRAPACRGTCWW